MNDFKMRSVRKRSLETAVSLGYSVNRALPLLDPKLHVERTIDEITRRALCLFCVVAVANNSNPLVALNWARAESLLDAFTASELSYLEAATEPARRTFLAQEEALWALTWATAFHNDFDHSSFCDNSLAKMFPNIRGRESSRDFMERAVIRRDDDIIEALDLAYCLHWAIVDEDLSQRPMVHSVSAYVIVERRRALEWLVSKNEWDEISLDT